MKTATALTVAAIGAIFAFAVTAEPSFFNFHAAGWVLMLTGAAGAFLPRRSYGWLRRRLVLNTGGTRRNEVDIRPRRFSRLLVPGGLITESRDIVVTETEPAAAGAESPATVPAEAVPGETVPGQTVPGQTVPAEAVQSKRVRSETVTTGTMAGVPVESDIIEQFIEE
jgi:hypothetical protein